MWCNVLATACGLFPDEVDELKRETSFEDAGGDGPAAVFDGLGIRLAGILSRTSMNQISYDSVSIVEADQILDKLASMCPWSTSVPNMAPPVPPQPGQPRRRTGHFIEQRKSLVSRLLRGLSPLETGLFVQHVLCREPAPVYSLGLSSPSALAHSSAMHARERTRNKAALIRARGPSFASAMKAWHPRLPELFALGSQLPWAGQAIEEDRPLDHDVGVPIEVRVEVLSITGCLPFEN